LLGLVRATDLLLMDLEGIAVLHIELFEITSALVYQGRAIATILRWKVKSSREQIVPYLDYP
jgi:hypothetical protein